MPESILSELQEARQRFLQLVDEVRPELHRYCARMTGSIADGEDVVQDTLARAYYALAELDEVPPLRAWLFRIAHNRAVDLNRRYDRDRARDEPGLNLWHRAQDDIIAVPKEIDDARREVDLHAYAGARTKRSVNLTSDLPARIGRRVDVDVRVSRFDIRQQIGERLSGERPGQVGCREGPLRQYAVGGAGDEPVFKGHDNRAVLARGRYVDGRGHDVLKVRHDELEAIRGAVLAEEEARLTLRVRFDGGHMLLPR